MDDDSDKLSPLQQRMVQLLFDVSSHDVTFILPDEQKPSSMSAHRLIMASLSKPFNGLLNGQFLESASGIVPVHDLSLDGLAIVITYAYTGEVDVPELGVPSRVEQLIYTADSQAQLVLDLVRFADTWEVLDLRQRCEVYFVEHCLSLDNAVDVLNISCVLSQTCQSFFTTVCQYFCSYALDIIEGGTFTHLSDDAVRVVLQQQTIFIMYEEDLLNAVCRWVQCHYPESRAKQAEQLLGFLPYLRDGSLSARRIMDILAQHQVSVEMPAVTSRLQRASEHETGRTKLHGFHFDKRHASTVTISNFGCKVTALKCGMQPVYMDRELIELHDKKCRPIKWTLEVDQMRQFIFAGVGCRMEATQDSMYPLIGSGFSSNGDLYQAIIESESTSAPRRMAARRVQRLKFTNNSRLQFTFAIGEVKPGFPDPASPDGGVPCDTCRLVRRYPFSFEHRHGTIRVEIRASVARHFSVTADIVVAKGVPLYPYVILKREGDTVILTD
ncbi:uncharacterized protein LOC135815225 [Sycon ciliatum]|uniref:uncharacterized protein LOC135815225 n=1 Tax=Sycon ciliatum TaxID=27933 RepID=UPI0020AD2AE1|eukprot:scpid44013/ scgid18080/ BTB/POZ domain-containing protein At2g30600